jgi:hypothetical protein
VLEPTLDQLRQLASGRLTVHHGLEGLGAHVRVGHARVGELADVRGNPVQLVERLLPRHGPGAARRHERAVDVEEEYPRGIRHRPRIERGRLLTAR